MYPHLQTKHDERPRSVFTSHRPWRHRNRHTLPCSVKYLQRFHPWQQYSGVTMTARMVKSIAALDVHMMGRRALSLNS
jgi:hypothetical protein